MCATALPAIRLLLGSSVINVQNVEWQSCLIFLPFKRVMRHVVNIWYIRHGWGFSERCKRALEITLCIKTDILYDFAYKEQLRPKKLWLVSDSGVKKRRLMLRGLRAGRKYCGSVCGNCGPHPLDTNQRGNSWVFVGLFVGLFVGNCKSICGFICGYLWI